MSKIMNSLIEADDCVLIIIDIQDYFLKKLQPGHAEVMLNHVGWLMEIARILKIPMIVTAEEPGRLQGFSEPLASRMPPGTPVFDKKFFGLAGQADILDAVHATGRKTAVLVGLETDVCVAQSAIGLLQKGFDVVAISDATDSPGNAHEAGLERMRNAGVLVTSLKDVYYEWVRTVELNSRIEKEHGEHLGQLLGIQL